ncbi:hypothetical protein CLAFUW4_01788 [Fulvia fulva]|uniref:Uncharacterized protein n=1 Tax=Passalora fulva TaxID=5499 RepID=A0A9Q8L6S5_PASFU|nr:uncharacterized protein CLAFUR5_01784 [Fulvia fulva]UJO11243.1 hypothetical protein CLAFUR5_01784 [Fulvia fulva]WPV08996.1 hypothetical protein CLAFUW4_01788 [Fulvia fulva]
MSAMQQVFATTELFDYILSYVLDATHCIADQEDPRSVKTHHNARLLQNLLRSSRVDRQWRNHILGSTYTKGALFYISDPTTQRAWEQTHPRSSTGAVYRPVDVHAPTLNPIIQTTFPSYNFRFCFNTSVGEDCQATPRHSAFLIITKRELPNLQTREATGQGCRIPEMLLAQPPCVALKAAIYEEIDDMKEYLGRTTSLTDPVIRCEQGLTLGMVHERVGAMFEKHPDVAAINLTTL